MTEPYETSPGRRARLDRIGKLLDATPAPDYERLAEDLAELHRLVREEISIRLQPAIKEKIRALPHEGHGEKQALARWVNGELRQHGLTIRCQIKVEEGDSTVEKTYSAILVADPGNQPSRGRFQLQCKTEEGKLLKPLSTPDLKVLLDNFDLMVDDPADRRWGKWTDLIAKPPQGRTP